MWEECGSTEVFDPRPHLGQGESCKTDLHLNDQMAQEERDLGG